MDVISFYALSHVISLHFVREVHEFYSSKRAGIVSVVMNVLKNPDDGTPYRNRHNSCRGRYPPSANRCVKNG